MQHFYTPTWEIIFVVLGCSSESSLYPFYMAAVITEAFPQHSFRKLTGISQHPLFNFLLSPSQYLNIKITEFHTLIHQLHLIFGSLNSFSCFIF